MNREMSLGQTSRIDELIKKQTAEFDAQIKHSKRSKRIKKQKRTRRSIRRNTKKQKRGTKEILETPISDIFFDDRIKDELGDDLCNLFNPNEIKYENVSFINVVNDMRKLLANGKIINLLGKVIKDQENIIQNFYVTFYNKKSFETWFSNLDEKSDANEWIFTGNIKYEDFGMKLVQRSHRGAGINMKYRIKEYFGEYCYIPSEDFCFIKCYNVLRGFNEEQGEMMKEMFNNFLYKEKATSRTGVMSNCKFSQFNKYFGECVQYYSPANRHLNPRGIETFHNYVYYNYFHAGSTIGHYCLINKSHKLKAIREIENNFKPIYKTVTDENLTTRPYKIITKKKIDYGSTYIWDLETFPDPNCSTAHPIPYAVGAINFNKFICCLPKQRLKELETRLLSDMIKIKRSKDEDEIKKLKKQINEYNNLTELEFNKLQNCVKIFTRTEDDECSIGGNPEDVCPIHQFFKTLGKFNYSRVTLIAHNSSGFDSYFPIKANFKLSKPPLKTSRGILTASLQNPYTTECVSRYIQKSFRFKNNMKKDSPSGKLALQTIIMKCSYQHVKTSLSKWCENFKIPTNVCKLNYEIGDITHENYKEKENEWRPYLVNDILSLAFCIYKYNNVMQDLVGEDITTNLTSSALTFNGWMKSVQNDNINIHSHIDLWARNYIRKSVKGGRVSANIRKYISPFCSILLPILKQYLPGRYAGGALSPGNNLIDLMKQYRDLGDKTEICKKISNQLLEQKNEFLMAFDATSLYPSAMYDENSEYPKAESARKFRQEEEREIVYKFNTQTFRPKTGIFSVVFQYPNDMFFQPVPIKDKVKNQNNNSHVKVIRFRNGICYDVLTSVDIQEIVRCGGKILHITDGIIYEKNYQVSPFRNYIEKLFNLRKRYKTEGNTVGDELIKLLMNSLYGKTVQKDITTKYHLWNENTLRKNFTQEVKDYEKLNDEQYLAKVEMEDDEFLKTNIVKDGKTSFMPSHLGSFILSHSRRIMNNFILEINGFKEKYIHYTDTDSIYISNELFNKLDAAGYVGGELCQGKNDYGNGGIIFAMFIAPKVKYCITVDEQGRLSEKKTFKGYSQDKVKVEDFLKLYSGKTLSTTVNKPWKRSLETGISIPDKNNNTEEKKFSGQINILKRQAPDENEIMLPYNGEDIQAEIFQTIICESNLSDDDDTWE